LKRATDRFADCSFDVAARLALEPEDPVHIAGTAITLCGGEALHVWVIAASIASSEQSVAFVRSVETSVREHIVAFVIAVRTRVRQHYKPKEPPKSEGQGRGI
jgi:hypothetical protein